MAHRKIIWSNKAVQSLDEIFQYIAQDSEFHAGKFIYQIKHEVDKLADFPELGAKLAEDDLNRARVLIYKKYKIIYELIDEIIFIHAVTHGARLFNFRDIL